MSMGYSIVVETTKGNVTFWTSWLENGFNLFYPLEVKIPDEIVTETLGITIAKPVKNVLFGKRLWEKYYSERLKEGGRVWIGQCDSYSYGFNLYIIKDQKLAENYCGHDQTNTIYTADHSFFNEDEPDAPNGNSVNIMPYEKKFIKLLIKISKLIGDIKAINFRCFSLYTPENLKSLGYDVKTLTYHNLDAPKKYYYTNENNTDIEIVLLKGNSAIPYISILRKPLNNDEFTFEFINNFLYSYANMKDLYTTIPLASELFEYYGKE